MKTMPTIFWLIALAATGLIAWNLKPSPPATNLYQGTATIEYFNEGEWWSTIYAAIQHKDLPRIQAEFADSTIQAYPFSVKHESFYIDGVAFGVKVVAVQIDSLRFTGTADVTVTPTGDIVVKPTTPGLTVSLDPQKVNLHKNKINAWVMAGAQVIPPYHPALFVGLGNLPLIHIDLGVGWLCTAPGIVLAKRW